MKYQITNVDAYNGEFTETVQEGNSPLDALFNYYSSEMGIEPDNDYLVDVETKMIVRDNGTSFRFEEEIILVKPL